MAALVPMVDWLTGFRKLNSLYTAHKLKNLDPVTFADRFLTLFDITLHNTGKMTESVPEQGPCLLVANHPLGAIEGVALASAVSGRRSDIRILANRRLQAFPELAPWFIFTEPLKRGAKGNLSSLRACHQHLASGGLLIVFPAGRVASLRPSSDELQDYPWHRSIKNLLRIPGLVTLPVFIDGRNSRLFYWLGKLHPQLRMMTLMREMLKSRGSSLGFFPAKPIVAMPIQDRAAAVQADREIADLRLLTFLQAPTLATRWADTGSIELKPLAVAINKNRLAADIAALPPSQHLISAGTIDVYYSTRAQTPHVVSEIQRLRESVFRELDEGSGEPFDGDVFDETYLHVFLFERDAQRILGACRLGRTDVLLRMNGLDSLYLNQMFKFRPDFINQSRPCLEMGRSFIAPDFQRSYQALQLLFKGIGGFIGRFPHYQTLYGTVSISQHYTPLSTLLIRQALVLPAGQVSARRELPFSVPAEMSDYLQKHPPGLPHLDWLVRQLEADGKGLPVLLRQYAKMQARFYAMGVDPNFAGTPGLLLSVDMTGLNARARKRFLT